MEYCSGLWEAPPFVEKITSPLSEKRQKWATLMYQHHPDKELTSFLLRGLETGFRIGYARKSRCISSSHNLLSCWEHPEEVQSYIDKERALGRVLGPFPQSTIPRLHVSPFGVIPKKATMVAEKDTFSFHISISHFTFSFLILHSHFSFRIPISHSHFSFRIPISISHFAFPFLISHSLFLFCILILHSHFSFRSLTHMYSYNCIQVCMVTSIDRSRKEMSELNSSADDTVAAGKERVSSSKRMQT